MIEFMVDGKELKLIKGHYMNERCSRSYYIFTLQ